MMTSSPCCTNTLTTLKMECLPPTLTTHSLGSRSEEHTSELQSQSNLVCRLLLEKKKKKKFLSVNQALVAIIGYATKEELLAVNHSSNGLFDISTCSTLTDASYENNQINHIKSK